MKKIQVLFVAILMIATYTLTAQVAITTDGSDPDASAMLDVKSTEKGFLPPRMTAVEIGNIVNPANGLMVYNNDDEKVYIFVSTGSAWKELNYGTGTIAYTPPEISDSYGGGIVAYIFQSGDPGYVEGETHGLIAAPSDHSTGMKWYNDSYVVTGATATAIGAGNANTNTIVTIQGVGSYAAQLCADLVYGGYSDWYLPSRDELIKLELNRVAIGGFANAWYWSSSEINHTYAYAQVFPDGIPGDRWKHLGYKVRAVRAF